MSVYSFTVMMKILYTRFRNGKKHRNRALDGIEMRPYVFDKFDSILVDTWMLISTNFERLLLTDSNKRQQLC